MTNKEQELSLLHSIRPSKIFIPVIIGLAVVGYMFYREYDPQTFSSISFSDISFAWLFVAFALMFTRDFGYVIRLKILSGGSMSWVQAIRVIFLWEFTSAVTPSAVGGTSIATLYVYKEGINLGKSTAIVLATSFLDELYFIIMFPCLFIFVDPSMLFTIGEDSTGSIFNEFFYFAIVGYSLKFAFSLLVAYGLFINPNGIKKLLKYIFSVKYLRRWQAAGEKTGEDIVTASYELRSKPPKFWIQSFLATALSWTSRYWVVNCLFLTFFAVHGHFIIFARQLVMWIMMLVSPTPGGSGFAEYVFNQYLGEFIPIAGLSIALAFLWRIISYYLYLAVGAVIFPRWIKEKF